MGKIIAKYSQEIIPITLDFSTLIDASDYIASTTWAATVLIGTDNTPSAIFSGTPTNTTKTASTVLTGGVSGVHYSISCTVTTHLGLKYILSDELRILTVTTASSARQDFADYCLRKLGAPVVNVEVDSQQLEDCIDDAILHFHEYHFDGIDRDYYLYRIIGTTVTVADGSFFAKGANLSSIDGKTTALISDVTGNVLTINKQMGFDKFTVGQTVRSTDPNSPQTTISAIVIGDTDNGYIPAQDNIVGVKKILNITSIMGSSDYMFNVQYQIMLSEVQNLVSQGSAYFYSVQQYLGHLDFIMKKEKDFRFNRRMNRLYLDVAWGLDVKVGDIVVSEVYRSLDEVAFPEIFQDIWLRRYTTALIKKMQGTNLRKYQGLTLPGGVTFDGKEIYDEAIAEIEALESEALYSASPLEFITG